MTAPDTSPGVIAAPAFTFDAPYEAYIRTGLFGEYVALHRAGELVATFSFREWCGEPTAIQAAWNFAYRVETCAECDALSAERDRLAAQVVQLQRDLDAAIARAERAEADMIGAMAQIGRLLTTIDDWDREFADKENGGLTMHTYGQTPDWFVEAAFWACYGFGPLDPRAALEKPHD